MDWRWPLLLSFLTTLFVLGWLDRKNIKIKQGAFFRKTKRGRRAIKKFGSKHRKLLTLFGNVSVILALLLSIAGLYLILDRTLFMFSHPEIGPSVKLVLPDIFPIEGICENVFCVPFWFWIISVFVIITPHELAHGVLAAVEKIRIKSFGLFLFLMFPGAFVELDQHQFNRAKPDKKLRIAAVGSVANIILFLILIVVSVIMLKGLYEESGVITGYIAGYDYPAEKVELSGVVTEIDGMRIRNLDDLNQAMSDKKPGDTIVIKTAEETYGITLVESPDNPEKGFIGIGIRENTLLNEIFELNVNVFYSVKSYGYPFRDIINWVFQLMTWIAVLDLNIAIANLLPFLPFDGGIMWHSVFEKFSKKHAIRLITITSLFVYALLAVNLIGIQSIMAWFG